MPTTAQTKAVLMRQSFYSYIRSLQPVQWLNETSPLWQDSAATTAASADTDPIGRWDDLSGNSNHAAQSTSAERTTLKLAQINGRLVSQSDNTSNAQHLLRAIDGTSWTGVTGFVVVKPLDAELVKGFWSFADVPNSGTPFFLFQRDSTNIRLYVDAGYRHTWPKANNIAGVFAVRANGTDWDGWSDGVKGTTHSAGLTNLANANNVYLHHGFNLSSNTQIGETILFNKALTDEQIDFINTGLLAKWGI